MRVRFAESRLTFDAVNLTPPRENIPLCFFFTDTATPAIYTPFPTRRSSDLLQSQRRGEHVDFGARPGRRLAQRLGAQDRKSTRLNSSHEWISYAVFCLKKKK